MNELLSGCAKWKVLTLCWFFIDIDVKAAGKFLGGRFACGASVTGDDEIVIQGDFIDDLFDVLPDKWPQVGAVTCSYKSKRVWLDMLFRLMDVLIAVWEPFFKQGIMDMNRNGNSANFFSYVCNDKKIKELFAFTLPLSVRCVSSTLFIFNA